jgi:hypothetical protein
MGSGHDTFYSLGKWVRTHKPLTVIALAIVIACGVGAIVFAVNESGKVKVKIDALTFTQGNMFQQPYCDVHAVVRNGSSYHLRAVSFRVHGNEMQVPPDEPAHTASAGSVGHIPLGTSATDCFAQQAILLMNSDEITILTCTMDGATEGDCQQLIEVEIADKLTVD